MAHWLMKSEPEVFSIADLERTGKTSWGGVRNYQARNFLRAMRTGDQAFFYHSGGATPAIVGIMEVIREAYPDPEQFDPKSEYHDPASRREDPRWTTVDVRFRRRLKRPVTLAELRGQRRLAALALLRRGNRLSVMPVTPAQWQLVLGLE
jgi:predicted RNA-binding protein with PUA-like domain